MTFSRSNLLMIIGGLFLGIGVGIVLFFGVINNDILAKWFTDSKSNIPVVPEIGSAVPQIDLQTNAGESFNIDDLHGKPVVINFWASWCGPCRLEMPIFKEYQHEYGDDLIFLAINIGETPDQIQAFIEEMELDLTVLLDPTDRVWDSFGLRGLPSTFFVDADGIIRFIHIGVLTESQLAGYLDAIGVAR